MRNKAQMISKKLELELRSAFHKYFVGDLAQREALKIWKYHWNSCKFFKLSYVANNELIFYKEKQLTCLVPISKESEK